MAKRWMASVLLVGSVAAACGGSESGAPTSAPPDTATADSAADTTAAPTTTEAPTTTLPATIDLATLPGRLLLWADTCGAEPLPGPNTNGQLELCSMQPDGTGPLVLSPADEGVGSNSAWIMRDGTHVLLTIDPNSPFIVDITTGERRAATNAEVKGKNVSPDLQWVIFGADNEGVFIRHPDGSRFPDGLNRHLLIADDGYYSGSGTPTWAPDSTRFAYMSVSDGAGGFLECPEVWVGSIDGTPPVKITDLHATGEGPTACPESLRWSPTGETILLRMTGMPSFAAENIYAINSDGSGLTALTHSPLDPDAESRETKDNAFAFDWSPDGTYIAVMVGTGNGYDYELVVMNADGSQRTVVEATPKGITSGPVKIHWAPG